MRSEFIKKLLQAHAEGDEPTFRKLALQLAAAESKSGHVRLAEELRSIIASMGPPRLPGDRGQVVDIARPRGELANLLEGGHRRERMRDIILPASARALVERVILETRSRAQLERHGVHPRRRLLFHGPPGCGKTLAAAVIAGELGVPLMTVRFDSLFSRFLGATANHLRIIFEEMPKYSGVYLFDEFDAVGKSRGDAQDVGEMRRIVTTFLQLVDADRSPSPLIAATNHADLLDHAVFRRFDLHVPFEMPAAEQLRQLLELRLSAHALPARDLERIARSAVGLSYADAARGCDDALRSMVLDGRSTMAVADLEHAFAAATADRLRPKAR